MPFEPTNEEINAFLSNSDGSDSEGIDSSAIDQFIKQNEEIKYDRPVEAFVQGALRGGSFGFSDVVQPALGIRTAQDLSKTKEYNPGWSTGGEFVGVAAPTLFSGGSSLLGSVARVASAPVRGVAALGAATEAAVGRNLAQAALGSTAKNILAKAAAKGAGFAVEGAMYGAGKTVSEVALGDHEDVAARLLANVGGSALLSGGIGAALPVAGFALKSAASAMKPATDILKNKLQIVSPEAKELLLDTTKGIEGKTRLDSLMEKGSNLDEVVHNSSTDVLNKADEARSSWLSNLFTKQREAIEKLNTEGALKRSNYTNANDLLGVLEEQKTKLAPGGIARTPEIRGAFDAIDGFSNDIRATARKTMGIADDVAIADDKLILSPFDIFDLKQQAYKSGSPEAMQKLMGAKPLDAAYNSIYSKGNEILREVGGDLKAIDGQLSQAIQSQKALSSYGFANRYGIEPDKFVKLTKDNSKWLTNKKHLETLDGLWGTNLSKDITDIRAVKELYPKDILSTSQTGKSLLGPLIGSAGGGLIGGPIGQAAGFLAGATLQTPAAKRLLVRGSDALLGLSNKVSDGVLSLGGNPALSMAPNLVPWVSAQVAGLQKIDQHNRSADRQINSGVNSFFKTEAEPSDEPITSSLGAFKNTNFGKTRVAPIEDREEAFRKRLDELTDIVSNPDKLTALMSKNLEQLSLVAPQISNALTMQMMASTGYLYNKLPKPSESDPLQPAATKWKPSDAQLADAERLLQIYDNPLSILKDLKDGTMTMQHVEDMRAMHPIIYKKIAEKLQESALKAPEKLSYSDRLRMSKFLGVPLTKEASPKMFKSLQSNFAQSEPVRPSNRGRLNLDTQTANERVIAR